MPEKIEIPSQTIFRVVLILFILLFLFLIRDVLLIFFVALVVVSALSPAVDFLQSKKVPRILSTLLIFLISLSALGLVIYLLVPPLVEQISALARNLPKYLETLPFDLKASYFQDLLGKIGDYLASVPTGLSSIFVILVISFYLLIQKNGIQGFLKIFTPSKHREYALDLFSRIQKKLGYWLLGQLTSCILVAVLTFIGLFFLKVPYALVLALAVGIAEIIPFGPVVAFIPAGILAFMQSPLTGILVIALYLLVQQTEGNIIVPQIMKKAVGLNPVTVILAVLIGAKLAGILGLLVAIPAAAALSVFIKDIMNRRKKYDQ
ncbi:MAG: AI-2E family transporter [bacterium]